jgi:hypothetical protein
VDSSTRRRGPDRDSRRDLLKLGVIGLGLVVAGVGFGALDPAPRAESPTRIASPTTAGTATPNASEEAEQGAP